MNRWSDTPDHRYVGTHRYEQADDDGNALQGIVVAALISLVLYAIAALLWIVL